MIGAECIRLLMMLIYEFAFDRLIMLLSIFFVETTLRAIVCSNFVSKVLILKEFSLKKIFVFKIVYSIVIFFVIVGIFILALTSSTAVACNN